MDEGWALPERFLLFHYFRAGKSLCGRYRYAGLGLLRDHGHEAPMLHDCLECFQRLREEKKPTDE